MTSALLLLLACGSDPAPAPSPTPAPDAVEREAPDEAVLDLAGRIESSGSRSAKVLFVSVKDPSRPGPPLAAKQLPAGPFPMEFTLTAADMIPMAKGRPVPAEVLLSARLDADGNATTREPGMPSKTMTVDSDAHGLSLTLE